MILGETETENAPLLGDDGVEGGEFAGDTEEGSFLGSKNKVINITHASSLIRFCNARYPHVLLTYPINHPSTLTQLLPTPYQPALSTCPIKPPDQLTLTTQPINPPYHPPLSTHSFNSPYQSTLSSHSRSVPQSSPLQNQTATEHLYPGATTTVAPQPLRPAAATVEGRIR